MAIVWFLGICEACRMYAACRAVTSIGPILCEDCSREDIED